VLELGVGKFVHFSFVLLLFSRSFFFALSRSFLLRTRERKPQQKRPAQISGCY
jgi:hypothetical protein